MIKKIVYLLFLVLPILLSCKTSNQEIAVEDNYYEELIINGDASNGTEKWGLYVNPPGKGVMANTNGEIEYKIDKTGSDKWHIQAHYAGLTFIKGAHYKLKVDMSSSIPRPAQIRIQKDSDPYTAYLEKDIELTTEMQTFTYEFEMQEESDEFSKLCFNLGMFPDITTEQHSIKVDNLSILLDTRTLMSTNQGMDNPVIAINQVGYLPNELKKVKITTNKETFNVVNSKTNEVVYNGKFSIGIDDPASGDTVYTGDFSDLKLDGTYYIEVPELGKSYTFTIGANVYSSLYKGVEDVFYVQRCGEDLGSIAGDWAHKACHTSMATIYGTTEKLDVSGGWHDAGDYGRYVGPGAKAVADLLLSNNLTEKLLSEAKYELDWMLKMQDKKTGGVYHKVTTPAFIGSVMPDTNSTELVISPISSTATADFAAIMAFSSRVYEKTATADAKKMLTASIQAWNWLEENPVYPGFVNPQGITTGEYGDPQDGDERFWAAVELYLSTGEEKYLEFAKNSFNQNKWDGMGWQDIGTYGVISYLFWDKKDKDVEFYNILKNHFIESVEKISEMSKKDGYGISLGMNYPWGSNEVVADNGCRLMYGYQLTENELYRNQALDHLNYLLGANSLNFSYVSGFGTDSLQNPHHRPSQAIGKATPGMLAGGPNSGLQDPLAESKLAGLPPAKCYIDAEPSYSTNEMTIYWNSPLYLLLSNFI
ncbi:MAG: glycoside hydrolase family 9 protein [Spirochaetales bacterium]|nr:glycoside hydrolase family 9 protein [Spirochaetales bacterium]